MLNNRQAGRRRGRGGQRPQNNGGRGPEAGNRIDNRARGNAAQLLEKYKTLARDAQMQGDRVATEYYLQFADHYFRVLAESRARFEETRKQRDDWNRDDEDGEGQDGEERAASEDGGDEDEDGGQRRYEQQPQRRQPRNNNRDRDYNRETRGDEGNYREARDRNDGDPDSAQPRRNGRYNGNVRHEGVADTDTLSADVLPPAFQPPAFQPVADLPEADETPAEDAPRRRGRPRRAAPAEDAPE